MKGRLFDWGFGLCLAAGLLGAAGLAQAEMRAEETPAASGGSVLRPLPGAARLSSGQDYLNTGNYDLALAEFERALAEVRAQGGDAGQEARIQSAYGYGLYLRQRGRAAEASLLGEALEPALKRLTAALELAMKSKDRALEGWVRISLGLVHGESGRTEKAAGEFRRAEELSRESRDLALGFEARLQLARFETSSAERLDRLRAVAGEMPAARLDDRTRINLLLNVTDQLQQLQAPVEISRDARELGQATGRTAAELAGKAGWARAQSQAEGYLAGLYQRKGADGEAIRLLEQAIRHGNNAGAMDLTMAFETRLGQALAAQGREGEAIGAYRRAAYYVSRIRNNLPIYYSSGKSSYRETLEPIYRGLADLLLRAARKTADAGERQALLRESIESLEQLKQTEMEDYFNDRCAFDSAGSHGAHKAGAAAGRLPQSPLEKRPAAAIEAHLASATGKTAILYPVLFDDRLELLLVHDGMVQHETVGATGAEVARQASALAGILRAGRDYRVPAGQLYRWLLSPLEQALRAEGIERIVYLPDGILRLVPLSALTPDGRDFAARHYAVITNINLQSAPLEAGAGGIRKALLAGLGKPSEALLNDSDLPDALLVSLAKPLYQARGAAPSGAAAFDRAAAEVNARRGNPAFRTAATEALALPEVENEIVSVEGIVRDNTTLLNEDFTRAKLKRGFRSGQYQLAHISTHSYFGHSARQSFIMAYDEILTVDEMEDIMKSGEGSRRPLELVTFSACETAQGDDRAPLGFSGLALKTKARNAIGALWPINDKTTRRFMEEYYSALMTHGGDKAKALQQAQIAMLADKTTDHPSFWAPFILVGAW